MKVGNKLVEAILPQKQGKIKGIPTELTQRSLRNHRQFTLTIKVEWK